MMGGVVKNMLIILVQNMLKFYCNSYMGLKTTGVGRYLQPSDTVTIAVASERSVSRWQSTCFESRKTYVQFLASR